MDVREFQEKLKKMQTLAKEQGKHNSGTTDS